MTISANIRPDLPDRITIESNYVDRHVVATVPGSRWDRENRVWHAPLSWSSCIALRTAFGDGLQVGHALAEWARIHKSRYIDAPLAIRESLNPASEHENLVSVSGKTPYQFQWAGAEFLATTEKGILSDPPGCGKTAQAILALRTLGKDSLPVLVVCPNTVKGVWRQEFADWAPELTVRVVSGTPTQRRKQLAEEADVYILNWEALRLHTRVSGFGSIALKRCEECGGSADVKPARCETHSRELNLMGISTVVADECHKSRNPKTLQARSLWSVGDQATYRFALSGTPIGNRPDELWSILRFLDATEWPAKSKFIDFWLESSFNIWGGLDVYGIQSDRKDAFFSTIDPHFRRMPKEVILPHLPDKMYTTRETEMSPPQRKAYDQMRKTMLARLEDGSMVSATNPLAKLTRLMQLASATGDSTDPDTERVRLSDPSCKVDALMEHLEDTGEDDQLVVFALSKDLLGIAAERLGNAKISYAMITGDVDSEQRTTNIQQFQNNETRVMLCTFGAGGEGITLTASDTVMFLQRSWSSFQNTQAEDRVSRPGAEIHDKTHIIYMVTTGTVEEHQQEMMDDKGTRIEEVVRDRESMLRMIGER